MMYLPLDQILQQARRPAPTGVNGTDVLGNDLRPSDNTLQIRQPPARGTTR
jgi:hypothetical protein